MTSQHPLEQTTGPFHDTEGVARLLGISEQSLQDRIAARTLVACRLECGRWVFPTWQFTDTDVVHLEIVRVWTMLADASDEWTAALWMQGTQDRLGGASATEWLTADQSVAPVLSAASEDIRRWAE